MVFLADIDSRSRQIFKSLVDTYLQTGQPVGSRTLSREPDLGLSPATIRNVMSDLTSAGLLEAPHASAGRLPTEKGLRLFVDGLMEIGAPSPEDRRALEAEAGGEGEARSLLDRAAVQLSGLTKTASLVLTGTNDQPLRQVSFVPLEADRALMVLVNKAGDVENRLMHLPAGLPANALVQAANFLNASMSGRTLAEARSEVAKAIEEARGELDDLTRELVQRGVADLSTGMGGGPQLIVKGQANLLTDAAEDLDRVQQLFEELERQQGIVDLLTAAKEGDGVRIFIGSENPLFSLSGSAVVTAPYRDADRNIVGVVGVVGPTRLNYARVIPLVDYTAEIVSRLAQSSQG
ncbi:heat-inducible transcription repressor [Parvularcula bermudensis HTCC2503]|uniref:Heat-inducible transcription repressor HrcA n=1 Tax=Parvularcula bermudensis (strain ATCC BAA-594 / HTCC2503 / KCTC 12087) TaxID=314260 RepID=E0TEM9_PARBH|nr:heat-inducible transcriptional repressor HrcA [Parvularcula bermudensis]ADM08912.1 heat-inducible transcription repressor [Parvularcula bermudensis HTCC2503]